MCKLPISSGFFLSRQQQRNVEELDFKISFGKMGKRMKKWIVFLFFGLIFLSSGTVQAALVNPYDQGLLDPVSFYVVDDPDSTDPESVVLTTSSPLLQAGYQLEYLYSGVSDWTVLSAVTSFTTPDEGSRLVFLRLHNPATGEVDTSGSLTFQGLEGDNLFTSLLLSWDASAITSLSFITAGNDDNLAPVPLPAAIWLLGSGFLGLCGLRRKS